MADLIPALGKRQETHPMTDGTIVSAWKKEVSVIYTGLSVTVVGSRKPA